MNQDIEPGTYDRENANDQANDLVLTALERLTQTTDDLARKVAPDSGSSDDGLRQVFAERFDRLEEVLLKRIDSQREKLQQDLDGIRDESAERWLTLRDEMAEDREQTAMAGEDAKGDVELRIGKLDEKLSGLITDFTKELGELKATFDLASEEQKKFRAGLGKEFSKLIDSNGDELRKDLEGLQEKLLEAHRSGQGEWSEGLGVARLALEKKMDELSSEQSAKGEALQERMESLSNLGSDLQSSNRDVQELVQGERERASDEAKERCSEQARRLNNAGVARYHAGDFEAARELFERATELDGRGAEAWNNLGLCLSELDKFEEATAAFEAAIELDPDLGAGYNNLGFLLYRQENFEAAIQMYREALGREHDPSAANTNLGMALVKLGQESEALAAWRRAVDADPANERARQLIADYGGEGSD